MFVAEDKALVVEHKVAVVVHKDSSAAEAMPEIATDSGKEHTAHYKPELAETGGLVLDMGFEVACCILAAPHPLDLPGELQFSLKMMQLQLASIGSWQT